VFPDSGYKTGYKKSGKIGEFGQPIIRKKADQMLSQFVENIKKQLAGG
jgi:carbon monoxide dehydrogenase subunit G